MMDREESIIKEYLEIQNFEKIVYEPDGNIPPDFAIIKENIAVEVRRLNQHYGFDNNPKPLEKIEYPLISSLNKILKSYSKEEFSSTYFVFIQYERPLKVSKNLRNKIVEILDNYLDDNERSKQEISISENLKFKLIPSSEKLDSRFVYGGSLDLNSGGFVVSNIHENLELIIKEKTEKVKPYLNNYKTWWLALVDYIGYGLYDQDFEQLKQITLDLNVFDKVLLVSPLNPKLVRIIEK